MSVTWNCQFIETIFFPEKATLGTPSVTNSRILLTRLPRNSWARLKSHLPAFKPVFFYSVPFSKTFHIFEDNNRVSTALSSQSLFCVLSLLWTVSGFSTLKKKQQKTMVVVETEYSSLIMVSLVQCTQEKWLQGSCIIVNPWRARTESDSSL